MKTNIILAILSLFLLMSACKKDDDNVTIPLKQNPVILSSLEAGQTSQFVRYHMTCGDEPGFEWTLDTLVLEVIEFEENEFFLKESLTANSPMFLNGGFQEPVRYPIYSITDAVLIPSRENSTLFFFYGNDTLNLAPNHDVELTQQGCKMMQTDQPFVGNDIGSISNVEVGSIRLANQTAVSCVPFFNLDAYLIYDRGQLNMSHVVTVEGGIVGPGTEEVFGWYLIQ